MPQSLTYLLFHIVFSTKNREPWIDSGLITDLHAYLGGILSESKANPVAIGGIEDHVHILTYLPSMMPVPDAVRIVKSNSSKWVHQRSPKYASFAWQSGYAAFTISRTAVEDARRYIGNQAEHHKTMSFQDEYRELLQRHGLKFDERYVWD